MGLITVTASSRKNRTPDKPNEDAYAVLLDQYGAVLVLADGVTRSRNASGVYPQPSGAARASDIVTKHLAAALPNANCGEDIAAAFAAANRAVGDANNSNGVWDHLDYGEHDLWGAVATAVVIRGNVARWGHIGDSAVLHLPGGGGLTVPTPDQVRGATAHIARLPVTELAAAGGRERYARQRLRNHPDVAHSYGVLTGEPDAQHYVVTGELRVSPGDQLVLCSDGLGSLGYEGTADHSWQRLERWLRDDAHAAVARLLDAAEAADERLQRRSDDKTVIVASVVQL